MTDRNSQNELALPLKSCTLCPRECRADRSSGKPGYCKQGAGLSIGNICAHRGEEPVISGPNGIANIFFNNCNLQCSYCQNFQISRNRIVRSYEESDLNGCISQIETILRSGTTAVGFVSPSHAIVQMKQIMAELERHEHHPVYVYNSNGYDKVETLKSLEGQINVYLPDMKYSDDSLAAAYSDCSDYTGVAKAALKEMFRQQGADIVLDEQEVVVSGMIVRHLVLPGHIENSIGVLRFIAEELSSDMHISLMSQYCPTPAVAEHPKLGRCITQEEYDRVLEEFDRLGFYRGWLQELGSSQNYRPDFDQSHPFESR